MLILYIITKVGNAIIEWRAKRKQHPKKQEEKSLLQDYETRREDSYE
jgi:hypothetical protein